MRFKFLASLVAAFAIVALGSGCASTPSQASAGEVIDDSVLTAKIKAALLKDPKVSGLAVSVETHRGMVMLSGFVKTQAESDLAHKIAHDTPGTTNVINSIQVR